MSVIPVGGPLDDLGAQLASVQQQLPSTVVGIATENSTGGKVRVDVGNGEIRQASDPSRAIAAGDRVYVTLTSVPRALPADPLGSVPVGACMLWLMPTAPFGWIILRSGATFDSALYPRLFALLGTTTLPDPDDRFLIGASGSRAVESTGGSEYITETQLPAHDHSIGNQGTNIGAAGSAIGGEFLGNATNAGWRTGKTGGGSAYWPRYFAVNLILYMG